ncbi:MAG: hypothetical protein IJ720_01790, partial [Clostridia bacterium]|nr:hypothetical protein [Clostridia bacterium]
EQARQRAEVQARREAEDAARAAAAEEARAEQEVRAAVAETPAEPDEFLAAEQEAALAAPEIVTEVPVEAPVAEPAVEEDLSAKAAADVDRFFAEAQAEEPAVEVEPVAEPEPVAETASAELTKPALAPELRAELEAKAATYRKNIDDARAALAATWNPAMKQRLQDRINQTAAKLAEVEAQLS